MGGLSIKKTQKFCQLFIGRPNHYKGPIVTKFSAPICWPIFEKIGQKRHFLKNFDQKSRIFFMRSPSRLG